MFTPSEPNPPARKAEDFPKTSTLPDGWIMDAMMDLYNPPIYRQAAPCNDADTVPTPVTGGSNGTAHPASDPAAPAVNENLFARRLDPFSNEWDVSGMGL